MGIRQINTTSPNDIKKWVEFPFILYAGNSYWVPQLISEARAQLNNNKHPFYEHSEAAFFIYENREDVWGRIAIIKNNNYNKHNKSKTAFFYLFDCVDDVDIANALFDAALSWAKERGLTDVIGPKGFIQGDGYGVLVEGFNQFPPMGIAYNHPYYDRLIRNAGFKKLADYFSGNIDTSYEIPPKVYEVAEKVKKRRGFYVKQFISKRELLAWAPKIREVYNVAFDRSLGFCPITESEINYIAQRILSISLPDLIKLVFKNETVVGFLFAYPNINKGLQKSKGKLFPFGWYHIKRAIKETNCIDFNGIGILPQHQGVGATSILYTELEKSVRSRNYTIANIVQVREDNIKSLGEMKALGITWNKTHRIYSREIA